MTQHSEAAWLIEMKLGHGTGNYWCGPDDFFKAMPTWGTVDNAIRFARKVDAEAIIKRLNTVPHIRVEIIATEHMWLDSAIERGQ